MEKNKVSNNKGLEVIWIGLPVMEGHQYTDTLNLLGYNTFDIMTIFNNNQSVEWKDIFLRRKNYNFDLYGDCNATIHVVRYFYEELLEEYPNAKFIVEVSDSYTWLKRFKKLRRTLSFLSFLKIFKKTRNLLDLIDFSIHAVTQMPSFKQSPKSAYDENIKEIKALIPNNKILYFLPNEGWKPLCEFLNKPIPTQELPLSGDSDAISRAHKRLIFNKSTRGQFLIVLYFLVLIGLFIYLGFFY